MPGAQQSRAVDRYIVQDYLAEGGMGAIYVGKKLGEGGFERQVVLKQLLPEYTKDQDFIDLFLREATISASLDHANIVRTIDFVVSDEEHFIVMEYLSGADLRSLVKRARARHKRFSPAAALYIGKEVLAALSYAHNKAGPDGSPLRLIHRDISPSNILISQDGEVKLTDFGIAKAATHQSIFYRVKGKVGYMSPEQARNQPLDSRSDLFSLAVCLFELMSGERLFIAPSITATPEQIYGEGVPTLSSKAPGIPKELDRFFEKALSFKKYERFKTAAAMQEAMLRIAFQHGLVVTAPELAEEMFELCGPSESWRKKPAGNWDEGTQAIEGTAMIGTELTHGTEAVAEEDRAPSANDWVEIGTGDLSQMIPRSALFGERDQQAEIVKEKELTLTSLIGFGDSQIGASPLVDLSTEIATASSRTTASVSARLQTVGGEIHVEEDTAYRELLQEESIYQKLAPDQTGLEHEQDDDDDDDDDQKYFSRSSSTMTWVIVAVILVVCATIALIIGFTGPTS